MTLFLNVFLYRCTCVQRLLDEAEGKGLALATSENDGWMSVAASIHAISSPHGPRNVRGPKQAYSRRAAHTAGHQAEMLSICLRLDRGGVNP